MQLKKISRSNGSSGRSSRSNPSALSRGEQAYRRLRDAIQSGDLKPGDRLLEVELAKLLGSSRTPVREALGRLESDGLAIRDPYRGMIIAELDASTIAELYAVREVLEGTAAALAARHASEDEIATLRQIADRDRAFASDPERLANNNRLFHEALYRSAHNRYLLKTLSALHGSMALVRTSLAYSGRIEATIEQHQAIVAAIERQDAKSAEELTRLHIQSARRARLALMLEMQEELDAPQKSELRSI
jgi:DNA-binding GntR family transcriptional regulator